MTNKVKVFNDNKYPLKELFKGEEVYIEAKDYWRDKKGEPKILDLFEANDFRGQYHPVPFDGSGKMLSGPEGERHFKMIRMEPIDGPAAVAKEDEAPAFKCMAQGCKHVSPSSEELQAHTDVRHPGIEKLILPEQDVEIKKRAKA